MRTPSAASFLQSELDTELLQKLFETANLTKHGATSLLQASYEEAINLGAIEFAGENSAGIIFVLIAVSICIASMLVMCVCDNCCKGSSETYWSDPDDSFIQTGEVAEAAEGHKSKPAFLLWLYKKKFGEEEGAQMKQCIEETSSKGPSLLRMAGLDPRKLKADLKNKDAKIQIQVVKATLTALLASFGETIQEQGLGGLGIGSCGHLVCAGDLQYAMDASGQHMCEWKCPKNSMPAEIASMGLSSANLNELKRLAPELEELKSEVEHEDSPGKYESSRSWTWLKHLQVSPGTAFSADPLRLVKMPSGTTFSTHVPAPVFLRHKGTCVSTQGQKFKVGDFVSFTGNSPGGRAFNIPDGGLVQIVRFPRTEGLSRRVTVKYEGAEHFVFWSQLKELVPVHVDPKARSWMLATNKTLKLQLSQEDPSDTVMLKQ